MLACAALISVTAVQALPIIAVIVRKLFVR